MTGAAYNKGETKVLQALFIVLIPLGILYLSRKNKFISLVSPILLSYVAGILIGNLGLGLNESISMQISEIAVPVAIPFILYAVDIKKWLRMTNKTIKSFILVIISAIISPVAAALLLGNTIPETAKISGMLAGCYTGGTPNLVAIGLATGINNQTLVLVNGADIVVGGLYFLFIIGLAPIMTKKILPPFIKEQESAELAADLEKRKKTVLDIVIAFSVMILIVGVSALIPILMFGEIQIAVFFLILTALSVGASMFKRIREIPDTYSIGLYFIMVFSVAMGSMVNFSTIFTKSSANILIYTFVVVFLAVFVHLLFAWIFRIDSHTFIITSVAGIFGPAFVPPVAEAIRNRDVVLAGITSGLVGYAVGNYIGLLVAWIVNILI
ncbi:MAG TPA: hypothetical protein DCE11_07270 [Ruminiclostridium sp.]|nr:hypothetical protein [Ruminiclostridium sp.]